VWHKSLLQGRVASYLLKLEAEGTASHRFPATVHSIYSQIRKASRDRSGLLLPADETFYWGADKSLAHAGRKQARKHVRDARDFNNIEMRAVIELFFLQGKAPKEIHAIPTETRDSFLPGWPKDLLASL